MIWSTSYFSLRDLADQHVVLVVAGHRDHHVGALDPGPLEHPELRGVAVGDVVLELLLDRQVAAPVALDHRHLVVLFEQLAGQVPADLAGADDDDVHQAPARPLGAPAPAPLAHGALEHVDRDPRRADRVQALALVPLGPQRVEDAGDHGRHFVAPLGDLGDDDVGVVAVGGGDEGVGLLDPGGDQGVGLEAGADREAAAEVLPGLVEADLEPRVRLRVLVEAGDFVAFAAASPGRPRSRPGRSRRSG